jgi:outer membrane lipoprotein-sorting protein
VQEPEYETQKLRKGELFYAKDPNRSDLRVNFETLSIDDQPPRPELEQYIFDGVWLTQIKYELQQARRIQQTEPNKPADPFELLSSRFPVVGFTNIEDLRKDFDITLESLPPDRKDKLILLALKVKPRSKYAEDYTAMDFWIDAELNLPSRIRAVAATEDEYILPDIHEITFVDPIVNKPIPPKTFDFQIPKGFQTETEPLKDVP